MSLSEQYDSVLFDLDGVLYRGDQAVPGAQESVARLREMDTAIAFVTNNSSRTPENVADTLAAVGIPATAEEVVTSAVATAELLSRRSGRTAFVIGEIGIRKALADVGIEVLGGQPGSADWVVVGWDRGADYAKLRTASLLVQRGASLIATNADAAYPAPDGSWPGAGALLAAVTTTTGATAEVVGKPHAPLFHAALERAGGGSALFVGDRIDTDVAGASAAGLDSLLVFTGVSGPDDLVRADVLPTYVGGDLGALFAEHPALRRGTIEDEPAIAEVLRASGLNDEAAGDVIAHTFVAEIDGRILGTVAVEHQGDAAHLRSLAVRERTRGRYLGTLLTAHAVHEARSEGRREVYLVTETADGFFARLGFERAGTLAALPLAFRAHMTACAESAATMRLRL